MRKIAANYILLPGFPLTREGYVVLDGKKVVNVVDTGGKLKEIQGLEFYGGMIVAGDLEEELPLLRSTSDLLVTLREIYSRSGKDRQGVCIIKGADLVRFVPLPGMLVERLI